MIMHLFCYTCGHGMRADNLGPHNEREHNDRARFLMEGREPFKPMYSNQEDYMDYYPYAHGKLVEGYKPYKKPTTARIGELIT